MTMMPYSGNEPEDQGDFEIKAKAAFEKLEEASRKMGLYPERSQAMQMPDGEFVLVTEFLLGDVAFSDRVQNPQKYSTNTMVNTMEKNLLGDTFLEERAKIQKRLAAGLDPMDDSMDDVIDDATRNVDGRG